MSTPDASPLGKPVAWPQAYDPSLLFPIERAPARWEAGLAADEPGGGDSTSAREGLRLRDSPLRMVGDDLWTAYELGWLDPLGKPRVGIAQFRVPAQSPRLVESKSLKLYLNSFAQARLESVDALRERIAADLSHAAGASVEVNVHPPTGVLAVHEPEGECIDEAAIAIDAYGPPDPALLRVGEGLADEALVSHLFRSNCPVTGQPDWASVQLRYRGPRIDREGLLRYLVSFRTHNGFHEQCVERIFVDVAARCRPESLLVHARFTRRGGLDINPWRATPGYAGPPPIRCARQ